MKEFGMFVGFYCDLVVGVVDNGVEIWVDKELFVLDVFVGVFLDIMALNG